MFVTFEGIDYSGKTTQATLLVEHLKQLGNDVVFLREPGGTAVSEKIRAILLDRSHTGIAQTTELLLFSAARSQLVQEIIIPSLQARKIVVCDRFYDSTTAYQGYGRGLDLDDVRRLNATATSGTKPDMTVFVDVEIEEITRRLRAGGGTADRMETSGRDFYERVIDGYRELARAEPNRFVIVNGMRPVEEIQEEIWNIIQQTFF
ncbi:MAG: dTMP kinase [Ignavibacteriae bacterium]|nr:dTMP kinase [Ignavibacteria bacterium]MBI3363797.1 dTMP kinase [Ignavibacteriota bacterium]